MVAGAPGSVEGGILMGCRKALAGQRLRCPDRPSVQGHGWVYVGASRGPCACPSHPCFRRPGWTIAASFQPWKPAPNDEIRVLGGGVSRRTPSAEAEHCTSTLFFIPLPTLSVSQGN